MTREQSDGRVVPEGQRKLAPTSRTSAGWGGKATTVKQQERQLQLPFGTAEKMPAIVGVANGAAAMGAPMTAASVGPKPRGKEERDVPTMMKEIAASLDVALQRVVANKGAPGPDRQRVEEVWKHRVTILKELKAILLDGSYR